MNDKDPLCLKLRNKTTRGEETYCKIYVKKFGAYLRSMLINYQMIGLFLGIIALALLCAFLKSDETVATIIQYSLLSVFVFAYLYLIIFRLWFWKYGKYVVVTNEGVWIMVHSTFWWGENFTGKKRFWSPAWSRYDWGSIKISDDDKARSITPVKIAREFESFDYGIRKSCRFTKPLFITRFDGVEEVDFLDENDVNEILAYAKEVRKGQRRKRKDMEIIEEAYDKLPDDEYVSDDEE